ncbi:MAG: hypothetical protein HQK84_09310, partial [Nitrospinae bacterium]|nr:hypothetical protein [Nitrospinota bacterium]
MTLDKTFSLPPWYEDFLLKGLKINVREKNHLKQQIEALKQIKEGLTKKRQRKYFIEASYLKEESVRKAYALYYMTNNLLKIATPLDDIKASGYFKDRKKLQVLDVGSGPGTGVFGLLLWLSELNEGIDVSITSTDNVEQNLNVFSTLKAPFLNLLGNKVNAHLQSQKLDIEKEKAFTSLPLDILTGLNVINEISDKGELNLIEIIKKSLKDDGFAIFIEPALQETSRKLLSFRDLLAKEGFNIYAPCL